MAQQIEVTLRVQWGTKHFEVSHMVDSTSAADTPRIIQNLVQQTAAASCLAFPVKTVDEDYTVDEDF